ncbi:hypothetical protein CCR79_13335 [Halorhodospira halophila]|nr:hypothetical protein [Halorhodospira halophila]
MGQIEWVSAQRLWRSCTLFGFGLGWGNYSTCLLVMFGRWLVVIGPHIPKHDGREGRVQV